MMPGFSGNFIERIQTSLPLPDDFMRSVRSLFGHEA